MLQIVIDTDVMVAAFDSAAGASRQLVLDVLDGRVRMLLSATLMLEYEDVLTRREVRARSGLDVSEVGEVLDELARLCRPVAFDYCWRPLAQDPADDHVLETAVNGMANVIASFNAKDLTAGAAVFGIPVERPSLVLRRIER